MKTYYLCAALFFLLAYTIFHFNFRSGGDGQFYKINDTIAFELQSEDENFNGISIRSYKETGAFVKFICGSCEIDPNASVEMVNINYRRGDFVYTNFPQHEKLLTDIINLKTGEAIIAAVPPNFKYGDDFSKLSEYKVRGLMADPKNKLAQDYVKANFQKLSTFTNRCFYAHVLFVIAALFLIFPNLIFWIIDAFAKYNEPHDPMNYYH